MKWFWCLASVYFLIAGNQSVSVFCFVVMIICVLDDRLTKLEQSIKDMEYKL
jgi:hypothetical protein